jgi:hypothetical protein
MKSSAALLKAIVKARGESLRFAGRPALHIVILGLAYQLSALRIVDILSHLPAIYPSDVLKSAS